MSAKDADKSGQEDEDSTAFAAGLEQLRSGGLWCSLASAGVTDKRLKSLCDILRTSGVTSLDVSSNAITDAGASTLAACLGGAQCAPDLISLNVAGNPLSETGRAALQSLAKLRRGLDITFTAADTKPASSGQQQRPGGQLGKGRIGQGGPRQGHGAPGARPGVRAGGGLRSALMSRYFNDSIPERSQNGGSTGMPMQGGPGMGEALMEHRVSPLEAAQRALSCASAAVAAHAAGEADGGVDAPGVCAALNAAVIGVDEEMAEFMDTATWDTGSGSPPPPPWWQQQQVPMLGPARPPLFQRIAAMPPATQTLALGAEVLVAVLTLAPHPLPWQAPPKGATGTAALRQGAGTHRVGALRLLLRLLCLRCPELDSILGSCGAAQRASDVLFTCTCSSPATMAATQVLHMAVRSPHAPLWLPLLQDGEAHESEEMAEGSSPPSRVGGIIARIVAECTAAASVPPGRREPHIGALIYLGTYLAAIGSGSAEWVTPAHAPLVAALEQQQWTECASGALQELDNQAQGVLCGPRPVRTSIFGNMAGLNPLAFSGVGSHGLAMRDNFYSSTGLEEDVNDTSDEDGLGGSSSSSLLGSGLSTLMSGRDLLTMLQSFGRMAVGSNAATRANGSHNNTGP